MVVLGRCGGRDKGSGGEWCYLVVAIVGDGGGGIDGGGIGAQEMVEMVTILVMSTMISDGRGNDGYNHGLKSQMLDPYHSLVGLAWALYELTY